MPSRSKKSPVVKTSVSLPVEILPRAKERAAKRGFKFSFSGYLAKLVEEDLERWDKEKGNPNPSVSDSVEETVRKMRGIMKRRDD